MGRSHCGTDRWAVLLDAEDTRNENTKGVARKTVSQEPNLQ